MFVLRYDFNAVRRRKRRQWESIVIQVRDGDEMLVTRKMVVIAVMVKMKEIQVLIELDNQLLDHMSQTWKLQVN